MSPPLCIFAVFVQCFINGMTGWGCCSLRSQEQMHTKRNERVIRNVQFRVCHAKECVKMPRLLIANANIDFRLTWFE